MPLMNTTTAAVLRPRKQSLTRLRTPECQNVDQITMEMFFRDMRSATLECSKRQLLFKIDHQLRHYSGDYSWDDPSHFVVIQFSSDLDARAVAREVWVVMIFAFALRSLTFRNMKNGAKI